MCAVDWPGISTLTEELPALVGFIDTEQRYRYVNRAYELFLNQTRDHIFGKTVREVTGIEFYAVAEPYIRRALKGEHVRFPASLRRRSDDALREVEVLCTPHLNDSGEVVGFISLIRDISERAFVAETHARLAAIIDSSDDAIVSKTLDGVITSWNRSAERIFGYTAAEAIGQNITLIIPPERRSEEDEVLARLRRGDRVDHFETERRAKDGHTVYVSLSVAPVRNAEGVVIGAAKVARDITERKRSEESLRAAEEYRRAVLESMPECMKVLDQHGVVLHMNPAGLRMVEASSPDEVFGQCVYPLVREEDREAFRQVNENVFHDGSGGRLEFRLRGLKGTERILETSVVPLRGARREVIGALSVTRDITSRKQAELRDALLLRLDSAMRSLSDPGEIMDAASRLLAEHLGTDRCSYADVDAATETLTVTGNFVRNVPGMLGRYSLTYFGVGFARRMNAGESYVIEDFDNEPLTPEVIRAFESIQTRAAVAVPLMKSGKLVAVMAVHHSTPRKWRPDEVGLVHVVAQRCWESLGRARVERELRESEQQFRLLADAIPNLAWMAHPNGDIFWYNQRWFGYTGTTQEDMEGWGWKSVHNPAILPAVLERWTHSIRTGEPFEMVFPLRGADGQFRDFLTRVHPLQDGHGRVARWFGTNTDVTAQQEAERREKRAREMAEILNRIGPVLSAELEPEKLTQKITDIATEAVRAEFGAFLYNVVNEGGESYLLYTLSGVAREKFAGLPMPRNTEVFGPTFRGEGPVRSSDITRDPRYGKNAPYRGMPRGHPPVHSHLAVSVKSRNGTVLGGLFFGHSQPGVFSAEDEAIVTGIAAQAAIALDNASLFDETRRSSEALRRSNEELSRSNADLNQFAYSASHDLREPLRMVSIYTQFLGRKLGGVLDADTQQYMEQVLKGTSRLEALIRDLLAYTKAAEDMDSTTASGDAAAALKSALDNLAATIEEAGVVVTVEPPGLPQVAVAEIHITQLLQNLIGNAVKYRSENPPRINIGAVRRGSEWEFYVADNGIGIAEEYKDHIFGVFKRLHNSEEYSGTGIGLAICHRIVQRYGGRIWVESTVGQGSTFFFTLPARS